VRALEQDGQVFFKFRCVVLKDGDDILIHLWCSRQRSMHVSEINLNNFLLYALRNDIRDIICIL